MKSNYLKNIFGVAVMAVSLLLGISSMTTVQAQDPYQNDRYRRQQDERYRREQEDRYRRDQDERNRRDRQDDRWRRGRDQDRWGRGRGWDGRFHHYEERAAEMQRCGSLWPQAASLRAGR